MRNKDWREGGGGGNGKKKGEEEDRLHRTEYTGQHNSYIYSETPKSVRGRERT